ncbi:MAG: SIS domain-containing protein [Nitrospinota bacterium]
MDLLTVYYLTMLIENAKKVLEIERDAIDALIDRVDQKFVTAVTIIDECTGRVAVSGMGKSGIIAKKIASTLASIGIPAFFLHPAEGVHGDLGMLTSGDVVIGISNSGQTKELLDIIPFIKRFGLKLISFTGGAESSLAKLSDVSLDISVKEEACPWDIIPTASTTATLALGDALSISLLRKKGVREEDFAAFHQGGSIGKNILLKVKDLMLTKPDLPVVKNNATIPEIVGEVSSKGKGVTIVVDEKDRLLGLVTDGDLRRAIVQGEKLFDLTAELVMTKAPKVIDQNSLALKGVKIMEDHSITSLVVVDSQNSPTGLLHLHDILKAAIV